MELHSTWFRGRTWGSVMGVANMIVPNATVRTRAGSLQKCILNLGDVNHLVRGPIPKVCRTTSSLGGGKILAISKGRYKHRRGKKKKQMGVAVVYLGSRLVLEALKRGIHLI